MGTKRMGMLMDESEQLYPEQSTTALIVYHPVAKYFSAWDWEERSKIQDR